MPPALSCRRTDPFILRCLQRVPHWVRINSKGGLTTLCLVSMFLVGRTWQRYVNPENDNVLRTDRDILLSGQGRRGEDSVRDGS